METRCCQYEGCTAETGSSRRKYCEPHREQLEKERTRAATRKHNEAVRLRRLEENKSRVYVCKVDGCDNLRDKPNAHMCPSCRAKARKDRHKVKVVTISQDKPIEVKPWTPRPKPKPLMTDAEQRRHDIALEVRLAQQCGYGHGEVKRLSKQEIAEIQAQIVPLDQIRAQGLDMALTWCG